MKTLIKSILILLFPTIPATSHGQNFISNHTTEIGGSILFASQNASSNNPYNSSETTTIFSFEPYFGFMLNNGFELGLMPAISRVQSGGSSLTSVNVFLAPAYNFNDKEARVYPFIELLIGYNSINAGASSQSSWDGLGLGFDLGMKLNVTGNGLLLFQVQYLSQEYSEPDMSPIGSTSEELTLNTLSFGTGFRVYFNRAENKKP